MKTENFIENIARDLGVNASIHNVYGQPIQSGEKTILPVARIAYGFGGGFGQGMKKTKQEVTAGSFNEEHPGGEGAGGGGGIYARPRGVYEITPRATRFIPANGTRQLLAGIVIGILLKTLFLPGKRRKVKK